MPSEPKTNVINAAPGDVVYVQMQTQEGHAITLEIRLEDDIPVIYYEGEQLPELRSVAKWFPQF